MNIKNISYRWERIYPHIIAIIITITFNCLSFNPISSLNIDKLVDGIVTLDSIIIGFMGAVIPVIFSMKNESKLVKYVFDRDQDGLFKKYISETVGYGLIDVCVSLSIYLLDIVTCEYVINGLSFLFVYMFFLFVFATYRSMSFMLKLLFSDDKKMEESVAGKLGESNSEELWDKKGK